MQDLHILNICDCNITLHKIHTNLAIYLHNTSSKTSKCQMHARYQEFCNLINISLCIKCLEV